MIYNTGITYSTPLFLYNLDLGSTIHQDHVDVFHRQSYNAILNFWKVDGPKLSVDQITDYDPYLGRITEVSTAPEGA